jgi:hypothetical protein
VTQRFGAAIQRLPHRDLPRIQRNPRLLIHGHTYRLHQEIGQHQGQSNQRLVGRHRLRSQRLAEKVKDHQQA